MKHLSYNEFSNIFGDIGITYWTKYNYLENPFKNSTINGVTNITFTSVNGSRTSDQRCWVGTIQDVLKTDSDVTWCYSFSNFDIVSEDEHFDKKVQKNCISVTRNGHVYIRIMGIEHTKEAYDKYLTEHPLVIYYYSSNTWTGAICNTVATDQCFYQDDAKWPTSDTGKDFPIMRDVQGKYKWVGNLGFTSNYASNPNDLLIGCGSGGLQENMHRIYFKNTAYNLNASNFVKGELPRAIVWTKTADAVVASEEEAN